MTTTTTNVKVGDKFNLAGAIRYLDLSKFDPNNFKAGDNTFLPIDLRTTPFGGFSAGMQAGQWSQISGIAGSAHWSNLFGNGDIEVYPNGDLLRSGQVRNTFQFINGEVIITPVMLNAQEAALVAQGNTVGNGYKPTILSSAFNTAPYAIKPPYFFGAVSVYPTDMQYGSGDWPAVWQVSIQDGAPAGSNLPWPPETDTQDGYNGTFPNVTLNMGAFQTSGTGTGVDTGGFVLPNIMPGDTVLVLTVNYGDVIAYFVGINGAPATCVGTTVGTNTQQINGNDVFWYGIVNYAVQGRPGAWPGPAPANKTTWLPFTIKDLFMGSLPAVYPGPGDGLTIPLVNGTTSPTGTTGVSGPTGTTSPTGPTGITSTTGATGITSPGQTNKVTIQSVQAQLTIMQAELSIAIAALTAAQAEYASALVTAATNITNAMPQFTAATSQFNTVNTDFTTIQTQLASTSAALATL
jgi:hypothetical protein